MSASQMGSYQLPTLGPDHGVFFITENRPCLFALLLGGLGGRSVADGAERAGGLAGFVVEQVAAGVLGVGVADGDRLFDLLA